MSFLSRRRLLASTGAGIALHTLGPAWQGNGQDATATLPTKSVSPPVDPYLDAVLMEGEPPLPQAGSFTFAVLPDTQFYSQRYPELFLAQTEWIAAQRDARRIAGVFHLGDITNNNTPQQWENARRAMQVLDDAHMPSCMVPGNHD